MKGFGTEALFIWQGQPEEKNIFFQRHPRIEATFTSIKRIALVSGIKMVGESRKLCEFLIKLFIFETS